MNVSISSNSTYVVKWNRLACDAIYYAQTPITIATRMLAMVHTAMYDAWTAFTEGPEASTTSGLRFKKPAKLCTYKNREEAYSYAAFRVLTHLLHDDLPDDHKDMLADCMRDLGYDPGNTSENPRTAAGMGNLAARLVIECWRGDGSNEACDYEDYTGYEPINKPPPKRPLKQVDRWQPRLGDRRKAQEFLTPHWGLVTPFALSSGSACRPGPPIPHDSHLFKRQRDKLKDISACLDDMQKMKAEYWSGMHEEKFDDSVPDDGAEFRTILPIQLCRMAQHVAVQNDFQNTNAIRFFFAVTNAMFDACIAVWDAKEYYDYARPESIIHELDDNEDFEAWGGPGQGTVAMQGEGWCPYVLTNPPYAEYVSTHSALAFAVAVVIECYCGDDRYDKTVVFPDCSSRIESEVTPSEEISLCWNTVHEAAEEAGMSRLYAGTNFKKSHTVGSDMGKDVAMTVWRKALFYFDGC